MFEIVDGRTDDGHRSDWYTISSHISLRLRGAKNANGKYKIMIKSKFPFFSNTLEETKLSRIYRKTK